MIFQIIGAFIAVVAFSVVLEAPKKYLVYGGIIGATGWGIYLLIINDVGVVKANFISALVIALLSHSFARIRKAPVTVFLIPGIMTLVPGGVMYKAVYSFIQNDRLSATKYLNETVAIAGMIALAIFVIDSVFRICTKKQWGKLGRH